VGTTCAETLGITPETYRSPDGESKCQAHSIRISGTRDAALDFVMANNIHLGSFWPKDD
jgi:hypothetical protein